MVPEVFVNLLVGSMGASAVLIGLLFVAVSIAPERIVGDKASAEQQAVAASAFMALTDAFFVSLAALIPKTNIGYAAVALSIIALVNTSSLGRLLWRRERRRITLALVSLVVYALQLWYGIELIRTPGDADPIYALVYLFIAIYAIGLTRAWELLGARRQGLRFLLGLQRDRQDAMPDTHSEERSPADSRVSD